MWLWEETAVKPSRLAEKTKLLDILTDYFNNAELDQLCFKLGANHERTATPLALIQYTQRHNLTTKLLALVQQERPFLFDT